jgi:hypothetical protein
MRLTACKRPEPGLALTTPPSSRTEKRGEFRWFYNPAFAEPESEKRAASFAAWQVRIF